MSWQEKTPSWDDKVRHLGRTREMSDIMIVVGDTKKEIPTHRLLLSSYSEEFQKIIKNLKSEMVLELPDVDAKAFDICIKHMYSNEVHFNSLEEAASTSQFAEKYKLKGLMSCCAMYVKESFPSGLIAAISNESSEPPSDSHQKNDPPSYVLEEGPFIPENDVSVNMPSVDEVTEDNNLRLNVNISVEEDESQTGSNLKPYKKSNDASVSSKLSSKNRTSAGSKQNIDVESSIEYDKTKETSLFEKSIDQRYADAETQAIPKIHYRCNRFIDLSKVKGGSFKCDDFHNIMESLSENNLYDEVALIGALLKWGREANKEIILNKYILLLQRINELGMDKLRDMTAYMPAGIESEKPRYSKLQANCTKKMVYSSSFPNIKEKFRSNGNFLVYGVTLNIKLDSKYDAKKSGDITLKVTNLTTNRESSKRISVYFGGSNKPISLHLQTPVCMKKSDICQMSLESNWKLENDQFTYCGESCPAHECLIRVDVDNTQRGHFSSIIISIDE